MTPFDSIERTLNACTPPLTLESTLSGYISITTGQCKVFISKRNCPDCPFQILSTYPTSCTQTNIKQTWPTYFPHIAKQFPELLL